MGVRVRDATSFYLAKSSKFQDNLICEGELEDELACPLLGFGKFVLVSFSLYFSKLLMSTPIVIYKIEKNIQRKARGNEDNEDDDSAFHLIIFVNYT